MARIALGQVDDGVTCLRRAIQIARENDDVDGLGYAYANLADHLNLRGRTTEALEVADEGLAATPRRIGRLHDWMMLTISELEFEVGNWEAASSHLGPVRLQLIGIPLIFRLMREADLGLGVGDEESASRCAARGRAAGRPIGRATVDRGARARCSASCAGAGETCSVRGPRLRRRSIVWRSAPTT